MQRTRVAPKRFSHTGRPGRPRLIRDVPDNDSVDSSIEDDDDENAAEDADNLHCDDETMARLIAMETNVGSEQDNDDTPDDESVSKDDDE